MNAREFVDYLAMHLPPSLRKVTVEDLKRWADLGVLRPHPEYTKDDLHRASGLVQMEQQFQKASASGVSPQRPALPRVAAGTIYQVLSILGEATTEADVREKATIRLALLHSGLISTLGLVYVNYSPFSGATLESMLKQPEMKSRFEKAAKSKELLIIREAEQYVEAGTEKEMFTALAPVLFFQGVKPTVVYSTFLFGARSRLLGPGQYVELRRPLHEEFLNTEMRSLDDVTKFMATHVMIGVLGVPPERNAIDFIKATQEKMRGALMKAARGTLGAIDLSPLSPFHEDDMVQANILGETGGMDVFTPEGEPASIGEIKVVPAYKWEKGEWAPYDKNKLHIKRYYCWVDYLWGEFIDAVAQGSQTPVCLRCGRLLEQRRGRKKIYCGRETTECFRARQAEYVRKSRERDRRM